LGARGIGEVRTRRLRRLSLLDRFLDLLLNLLEVDTEVLENGRRDSLPLANQSEQDVFSSHVLVMQALGLLARHLENLANSLGEVVAVHDSLGSGSPTSLAIPIRRRAPAARTVRAQRSPHSRSVRALRHTPSGRTGRRSGAC